MLHFFKLMTAHVTQWYCYNNIRAVLILILVSTLGFKDSEAFTAYATMIALGDINSMAGAYYGDRVVGHHFAWLFGATFLLISYFIGSIYFTSLSHNGIYLLNMISCGIGIARCNGSSLVYTSINKEFPENQRHSYNSLLYLMLILASFIAYSTSGIITQKFGPNSCFFVSFAFVCFSILLFIHTEFDKIKQYFSELGFLATIKNFLKILLCLILITVFGILSFNFYQIVNITLWLCFLSSILFMIYLVKSKKSVYSSEEKRNIKMFIYYIFWFVIYFIFERQFGMIMPLILSRNFDNNILGFQNIPPTTIMSIFQLSIIFFSIILFKYKTHDKLSNRKCLFIGFLSSLLAYAILYTGSVFHSNYNIPLLSIVTSIILFSISDLFILNRIFSICRVAPKKIHALTTAVMMVAAACSFYGARWIARFVEIDKTKLFDKEFTLLTYKNGFFINLSLLVVIMIALSIISVFFYDKLKKN